MKKLVMLLTATIILSSSAFFYMGETEVVEAKPCPIGEYSHLNDDGKTECKSPVKIDADGNAMDNVEEKTGEISKYMLTFVKAIISLIITIGVLIVMFAGYKYIVSAGNPKEVEESKRLIRVTAIGALFLFSAYMIAQFMINLVQAGLVS